MTEYKFKKEWEKEFKLNCKNSSPVADGIVFAIMIIVLILFCVAVGG